MILIFRSHLKLNTKINSFQVYKGIMLDVLKGQIQHQVDEKLTSWLNLLQLQILLLTA